VAARGLAVLLAAFAVLGAVVAFLTSSELSAAVPAAVLAMAAASGAAAVVLAGSTRFRAPPDPPRLQDAPVELLDAFRSGRLGRVTLIGALRRLDRAFDEHRGSLSVTEEERLLAAPANEFLGWVEAELDRLESST
jgi:hypothetical protein